MTENAKEISNLMGQHDAIRAQMKFLLNSLQKLSTQPGSTAEKPAQVKEWLQNYCYALCDLRDGVQNHIELDERIFKAQIWENRGKHFNSEHKNIKKQIDLAIQLLEDAMNSMTVEELHQHTSQIKAIVEKTRKLIDSHTSREDKLLRPV